MPSPDHLAIIAAAGSHKTEFIVTEALERAEKRILITTYTTENLRCIEQRVYSKVGRIPENLIIMSWYQFLLNQWCRPYQRAVLGKPNLIRGIDFETKRPLKIPKSQPLQYYVNRRGDLYRNWVADFAVKVTGTTAGHPVRRLEAMFDEVYIDELQDLSGYDLEVIDQLLASTIRLVMVGDPRQSTFWTNDNAKNRRYRSGGLAGWLNTRQGRCTIETRHVSYRCNQAICDFADGLYPELPTTQSVNTEIVEPSGILQLSPDQARNHIVTYQPVVLRWSNAMDTLGFRAMNFGASKGSTFDHVVIFPTGDMKRFLRDRDPNILAPVTRSKLYVAVTRAQHSVAFVV